MKLSVIKVIRKSDGKEIGINTGDFDPKKHTSLPHPPDLRVIGESTPRPSEETVFPEEFDGLREASVPESSEESDASFIQTYSSTGVPSPSEASDVDFIQTTPESEEKEPDSAEEEPDSANEVESLSSFNAGDAKRIIAGVTDLAILNEMEEGEKNGKDRISVANAIDRRREEL